MAYLVPDGLRHRHPQGRQHEQERRELLQLQRPPAPEDEAARKEQHERQMAVLRELVGEVRQTREQMAEGFNETVGGLQRIEGTTERLEKGQDIAARVLGRIDAGVKKIASTTDEILGVTKRIDKATRAFRSGNVRDIINATILDEWLVFYAYFLLHPWMPVTTEAIASVWQIVLLGNRLRYLRSDLSEGRLITFSVKGMVYNYFTSPWKAIALLYFFNQQFARMRGADPAQFATLFPGSLDVAFQSFFSGIMSGGWSALGAGAGTPAASLTFEAALNAVKGTFARSPELWTAVHELCPTWEVNKTGFFNCIAAYMVGQLQSGARVVGSRMMAVPGLAHQMGMYTDTEMLVIGSVMSFLWNQIIYPAFGTGLRSLGNYLHGLICGVIGNAWGFGWVGCDKLKTAGGGSATLATRSKRSAGRSARRSTLSAKSLSAKSLSARSLKGFEAALVKAPRPLIDLYRETQRIGLLYVQAHLLQENLGVKFPPALLRNTFDAYGAGLQTLSALTGIPLSVPEKKPLAIEDAFNSKAPMLIVKGRSRSGSRSVSRSRSRSRKPSSA
jgi:hypothetical protein